jgi:hypothetical protein
VNPRLANSLWQASTWPDAHRFRQATRHVAETQARLLSGYLQANADTDFGRRHGFARLSGSADFRQAVPLSTFDDYAGAIERIGRGEQRVLTAEPVRRFEPSGGSTTGVKLLPYTASLQAEFRRGIAPWIADLFGHYPALKAGRAYWSVTPLAARQSTPGGIPIGFDADSAYLGRLGRQLFAGLMAVPDAVKRVTQMPVFRYVTLLRLLSAADLRLISVWNPTYLMLLLAELPQHWDALLADIAAGTLCPPGPLTADLAIELRGTGRPNPTRARELSRCGPEDLRALWPGLALVSCWADGPAASYAEQLAARLPGVVLQAKGLLATEAFVTLPLVGVDGAPLAVCSHFFEFLPDDGGEARLAHELDQGRSYEVVVTTGGGLYRYRLQDRVLVTGHFGQAPCLRFLGKTDRVSDWFGEKLSEPFVAQALAKACAQAAVTATFALLAPDDTAPGFRYTLYLEPAAGEIGEDSVRHLGNSLDQQLRLSFHYDWCRQLGQLGPVRVVIVQDGARGYLEACRAAGQRLGDVKPAALVTSTGWGARLAPAEHLVSA